jgi:uridylate kinase
MRALNWMGLMTSLILSLHPTTNSHPTIGTTKELKVMDATAISLLKENKIPIVVFRIRDRGGLKNVLTGQGVSTVISGKKK